MPTVQSILKQKASSEVISIAPSATVFEAIKLLADKNLGAVLVLDSGQVVGIFSERDYARRVILAGKASKQVKVADVMTTDVIYTTLSTTVEECMALMINKHIRHLPVLENNVLKGVISIGDAVKSVIGEKDIIIEHLERYIRGGNT